MKGISDLVSMISVISHRAATGAELVASLLPKRRLDI